MTERSHERHNRRRNSLNPTVERIGQAIYYALIATGFTVLLSPVIIVIGVSFNATPEQAFPPKGVSLRWFIEFFQTDYFVNAFFAVSLPIALLSAAIATLLSVAASYALVRYDLPGKNAVQSLLIAPIMIPGVIIGLALLLFLSQNFNFFESSYVNITLGHSLRVLPYPLLTSITSLYSIDDELEQASRNLGATNIQTFYKVVLPLMKSGVIAGFLLAFIVSFADVNIALFLIEGNTATIPVVIFQELQYQTTPVIAAISTIQIVLILLLILVIGKLVGFETVMD